MVTLRTAFVSVFHLQTRHPGISSQETVKSDSESSTADVTIYFNIEINVHTSVPYTEMKIIYSKIIDVLQHGRYLLQS